MKEVKLKEILLPPDPIERILGQEKAKKAIELAIAGDFSILFYGVSGCGKSSLVKAYDRVYTKIHRRKPKNFDECDFPTEEQHDYTIFAEVMSIPFSIIARGPDPSYNSKIMERRINRRKVSDKLLIEEGYMDSIGQSYSKDKLTPKIVFNALEVAKVIAELNGDEYIQRDHFREALKFVTVPIKKKKHKTDEEEVKETTVQEVTTSEIGESSETEWNDN